ncbi:hypothetical protein Bpro_1384 [Polaromonas sp. JS666]|nr:hypothetical protein Bpro_1384 [Polaromonas sp. JS666]
MPAYWASLASSTSSPTKATKTNQTPTRLLRCQIQKFLLSAPRLKGCSWIMDNRGKVRLPVDEELRALLRISVIGNVRLSMASPAQLLSYRRMAGSSLIVMTKFLEI